MKKFLAIVLLIFWGIMMLLLEKLYDKTPDTTIWTIIDVALGFVIFIVWIILLRILNDYL
jgi:hypothetical protein